MTALITSFLSRGHHVTLYTVSKDTDESSFHHWGNLRVFVGPCRSRHLARNFFLPEIDYLQSAIQQDGASFVHAHWTYEFALAPLRAGVKTLVTIHDLPWKVLYHFRDAYRAVRLMMAYEVAWRGRHFTAVSNDAANHFRRYLFPKGKVSIIPNGLPDWVFEGRGDVARTANPGVVFASVLQGWTAQKNPKTLLAAFARVREALPAAELRMFGMDYEEGGRAQQWAAGRKLDAGVRFIGALPYQELLRRVAEEVDIAVHPTLDESFSMSTVEAMALGKPVIGGVRTTGVREVLDYGRCGVLTDVRSPEALGAAMLSLAMNPHLQGELVKCALHRAQTKFRLSHVVDQYEQVYREIQYF
ncbi:MAG: glycosyltransferase family 4 protein [Terracidiphilus sp.]|nr:glycosyltransferase family 4 protein [Terracidiphilus sp.]